MSSDASQQEVQQVEIQQITEKESEKVSWDFKRAPNPSIIPKPDQRPKKNVDIVINLCSRSTSFFLLNLDKDLNK
jgi:hypothetical protein